MKLRRISIVTLKEKTLELEHNQDKYAFCFLFFFSTFNYLEVLSMLSMFPLYIYLSLLVKSSKESFQIKIGNERTTNSVCQMSDADRSYNRS